MTETQARRRMDRIRVLLATRNDYVVKPVYSDDPPVGEIREGQPLRVMTPSERDHEIERLERQAAVRENRITETDREWWESALEARNRMGSYQELDRVLGSMDPQAVKFLDLYHSGFIAHDAPAKLKEERIVRYVSEHMRGKVTVPQGFHEKELQVIGVVVRSLSSAGHKIQEVAREVGISRRLVSKLLQRNYGKA